MVRPHLVPLPEPGTVLSDRFVIESVLGKGGTGVVFVAFDRRIGQRVAIKLIHPDLVTDTGRERLRREVQAARHGHANVVTVFDLHDVHGPMPFLSMELVDGKSLAHVLEHERRRLGIEETIAIGRQLAMALDHLHGLGLVHRDVKPGNILLTADGAAKLCDLGLVRNLEHGMTMTASAMTVGTPAYMAPEQGTTREVTPKADVYALGLTLYECLTGKVPHARTTAVETLLRRQKAPPPALRRDDPHCPAWLERLLGRMLEPRPGDRPGAIDVARALETRRARRRFPRRAALVAAVALVLCGALALGWKRLAPQRTVRMDVQGRNVDGFDRAGRPTWSVTLRSEPSQVVRSDLDGDGTPELIVTTLLRESTGSASTGGGEAPSEVVATSLARGVLTRLVPSEAVAASWLHPFAPKLDLEARAADLDGDGTREILLVATHHTFYPCLLFVYWPRWDSWDWILDHTGALGSVTVTPDAARPRIELTGVTNRLGMFPVVAQLTVVPPPLRRRGDVGGDLPLRSPQDGVFETRSAAWYDYVLLPDAASATGRGRGLEQLPDGAELVRTSAGDAIIDAFGNLAGGPNAGRDLRSARLRFLGGIAALRKPERPIAPEEIVASADALRVEARAVLAEPQYRAALDLTTARALARVGDLQGARDVLRRSWRETPFEDVGYRLAHLEALAGNLRDAAAALRAVIRDRHTSRGNFDCPHLLVRVGIEMRDERTAEEGATLLSRTSFNVPGKLEVAEALRARARLWWDRSEPDDQRVTSQTYTPAGAAIACLARWRAGRSLPRDIAEMQALIAARPDAAPEGTLALAASQLATGAPHDALATLDKLVFTLTVDAREDFSVRQILDLARALRCQALLAAGRADDARRAATALRPALTPLLLPARVVDETLDRAGAIAGEG